jgi:hypothetical protein
VSRIFLLCLLAILLVLGPNCGHPTQLTSVDISPTSVTVIGRGGSLHVQFTATGKFIHPTETRDITKQVTWSSALPDVATIDQNGVATSGLACGFTPITATAGHDIGVPFDDKAVTSASAQFTVADPTDPICPKQ